MSTPEPAGGPAAGIGQYAAELATRLGHGWHPRPAARPGMAVVGHPDGRAILIQPGPAAGRLCISGQYPPGWDVRHDEYTVTITVSAARAPASVAAEIRRRLLSRYEPILARAQAAIALARRESAGRDLLAARLVAAVPGATTDGMQPRDHGITVYLPGHAEAVIAAGGTTVSLSLPGLTAAAALRLLAWLPGPSDAQVIEWAVSRTEQAAGPQILEHWRLDDATDIAAILRDAQHALREHGGPRHILAAIRAWPLHDETGVTRLLLTASTQGGRRIASPPLGFSEFLEGMDPLDPPEYPARHCVPVILTRAFRIARLLAGEAAPAANTTAIPVFAATCSRCGQHVTLFHGIWWSDDDDPMCPDGEEMHRVDEEPWSGNSPPPWTILTEAEPVTVEVQFADGGSARWSLAGGDPRTGRVEAVLGTPDTMMP